MEANPKIPTTINSKRKHLNDAFASPLTSQAQLAMVNNAQALRLPKWRAALGKVKAGTGNARLVCIGDSIMLGTSALGNNTGGGDVLLYSQPAYLSSYFNASGVRSHINAGFGSSAFPSPSRVTIGSAWQNNGPNSLGGPTYQSSTNTNPISITPNLPVDTFKIYYLQASNTGVISYNINGGTASTITTTNATTGMGTLTVTAPLGINTLNLYWSSGGGVFIAGWDAYDSSKAWLEVLNCGWYGSSTGQISDVSSSYSPAGAATFAAVAPSLTIISNCGTDWIAGSDIPFVQSNLQRLISAALVTGDVALISPTPIANATISLGVQRNFQKIFTNLAIANNIPLIDQFSRFVSFEYTNPLGFYYDDRHMVAAGYSDLAQGIFNIIGNP